MGPPRFELESRRPERHRMDQATLRAHDVDYIMISGKCNIYYLMLLFDWDILKCRFEIVKCKDFKHPTASI